MAAYGREDAVLRNFVNLGAGERSRLMLLQGQRCALRRWQSSDAASLVRHANNLNVARQLRDRFPNPYSSADAKAFLKATSRADPQTNFAIDVSGEAVGGFGYVKGHDVERYSAEVGYWLGEACWGHGIATEALQLFTKYAFADLEVLRLFAVPFADNKASMRVLEKAGYALEGVLRSSCVKYGQPRDQAMYSAVNPGWSVRR
jgi:RimJ/RimL family protein N-acetyltransferase